MSWPQARLADVCTLTPGYTFKSKLFSDDPSGTPVIRIQNVTDRERSRLVYTSEAPKEKYRTQRGDLLLSISGSFAVKIWDGDAAYLNQRVVKIVPETSLDTSFLARQLAFKIDAIRSLGKVSSVSNISLADLHQFQVSLPPLSEQKRIAAILGCADAIRETRRETLKTCDDLLRSIFFKMFGDPVTNPMGWEVKPFIEMATLQRGFDLPAQARREGTIPIFAANGPVGTHHVAKVKGPGVVTGRSGTIGEVHWVEDDYWPLNTSLWVKNFHGNHPRWIARFIQYYRVERFVRGTGISTLNRNLVHAGEVGVPPLDLQDQYANIEEHMLRGMQDLIKQQELEETLFNSLVQRAFRGEL